MENSIDYQKLLEKALISIVRQALIHTQKYGLDGNHHFFITFKTRYTGVKIPDLLRMKYPEQMTIVLQYEFNNLNVSENEFGVTLTFNGTPFYIRIPFNAITEFRDPGVDFILQFNPEKEEFDDVNLELPFNAEQNTDDKIVQIDKFRKH